MIDFPIDELLDDAACLRWLEQRLHTGGLRCPRCGGSERRLARQDGSWAAWRCKACDRYYTLLSGTAFQWAHQPPPELVLLVRGTAKGEPTARLARELGMGRVRVHEPRQQVQRNLPRTRPAGPLPDEVLGADELSQDAGKKASPAATPVTHPAGGRCGCGGRPGLPFFVSAHHRAGKWVTAPACSDRGCA